MRYIKNYFKNLKRLASYKDLLFELTKRDFLQRYKGSYLGFIWAFISPLIMLAVYSFIFVIVFKTKWDVKDIGGKSVYTLMIFSGLVPFYIFSESVNRSLTIIQQNANYVKKVVIPIEILPISMVLSTALNQCFAMILLVIGKIIFLNTPNWSLILIPLILVPIVLISLICALIFSAIGVYIRDLAYIIGIAVNVLFYMAPIFYSINMVPDNFKFAIKINPISYIIEQWRDVFVRGQAIDFSQYLYLNCILIFLLVISLGVFYYMRKGFADVV